MCVLSKHRPQVSQQGLYPLHLEALYGVLDAQDFPHILDLADLFAPRSPLLTDGVEGFCQIISKL